MQPVNAGALPPEPPAPERGRGRPSTLDRSATLDAAWRVIADRGMDRARYADVARESGTPVSTLQNAFGSLQSLLNAAVDHAGTRDAEFLASIPGPEADPATRLEAFVSGAVGGLYDTDSWLVWLELWRAAARDTSLSMQTDQAQDRWWDTVESIIAQGQETGAFTTAAPAGDLARALVAMIDGLALAMLLPTRHPDPVAARRIARSSISLMLAP